MHSLIVNQKYIGKDTWIIPRLTTLQNIQLAEVVTEKNGYQLFEDGIQLEKLPDPSSESH